MDSKIDFLTGSEDKFSDFIKGINDGDKVAIIRMSLFLIRVRAYY